MTDYMLEQWRLLMAGDTQGIFFWGAFYTLLLLCYSLINQLRTARWPWTPGTLASNGVDTFGPGERVTGNQHYAARATYEYVVDGESFEGHRVSPWVMVASHNARGLLEKQLQAAQRLPDGRVKVFYNPVRPGKSFLVKPGPFGQLVTAVLAVLPLALYWLRYHT